MKLYGNLSFVQARRTKLQFPGETHPTGSSTPSVNPGGPTTPTYPTRRRARESCNRTREILS